MSLLMVEGFEGYGTTTGVAPQPASVLARSYAVGAESSMDIETGRLAGYSLECINPNCWFQTPVLTTDDTLIVGCAFKVVSINSSDIFNLYDGGTQGIRLYIEDSGQITVYRGVALLGTSVSSPIQSADTWYFIELKIKCSDTVGTFEVRVGGVNVLSGSGVDTKQGIHDYYNIVKFVPNYGGAIFYDDIYICDSTGSVNNDFLGNCRVVGVLPDGDDTAGWDTASGGSSHYLDVDENPADDDTSYVEDATSGHKDLYDYAAMTAGLGAIKGLAIRTQCRETDANNFSLITPIKSSATEDDDSAQAIASTDYVTKTRISEIDPNTSTAWTETTVNAAKFGVKVG